MNYDDLKEKIKLNGIEIIDKKIIELLDILRDNNIEIGEACNSIIFLLEKILKEKEN